VIVYYKQYKDSSVQPCPRSNAEHNNPRYATSLPVLSATPMVNIDPKLSPTPRSQSISTIGTRN
jgi:hypothetical protein